MSINYEWYDKMLGDVVGNLKKEIEELTYKVKKSREDENWGTYKNLVLAYKEIIKLYKEIILDFGEEKVDKTQYIESNLTLKLDKIVVDSIKQLREMFNKPTTKTRDYINLFEDSDFGYNYNIFNNNGDLVLKSNLNKLLEKKLKLGLIDKKLVNVHGFRGIGKTHNLINIAKINDYMVIVPQEDKFLRTKYNYDKIYNQNSSCLIGIKNRDCVIDEGVDINKIKNELGLNIITGYINIK